MIDLRLPKNVEEPKHHIGYLMCTVQVPLIGITDAVSKVLWLGLLVRVLAIITKCADCHAIHIQINMN